VFSEYFGHYLLNRDLITRDQLVDALEFQKSVHVKFGVLAVDEGYMTPLQVEEVHEKQKQMDKRFGEIAVDLGYLTHEQVEHMLTSQKQEHLLLAQALVDRDYMTIDQFSKALNDYKREYGLSDDEFEAIKNGNIEVLVETFLKSTGSSNKDAFVEYLSLFARNIIRFIDEQIYIEVTDSSIPQRGEWIVQQEIVGDSPLFTAISADKNVFLNIASAYAEEELTVVDDLAEASVGEFLNLHNGIFLVNLSNRGIELNMKPPKVIQNGIVEGEVFFVTVNTPKGSFQLLLSEHPEKVSLLTYQEMGKA
jgi:CheY-specific phosphatase CheX